MTSVGNAVAERPQPRLVMPRKGSDTAGREESTSTSNEVRRAGAFNAPPTTGREEAILRQVQPGLRYLSDSYARARQLARDPWEFAVEWSELQRLGLTCNDVRWLIHHGLVEHACEITAMEDSRRRFLPYANLSLSGRVCLIVTEEGTRLLRRCADAFEAKAAREEPPADGLSIRPESAGDNGAATAPVPKWDCDRRQLRVGTKIVKEFKVPAPNQEIVLAVFEEEMWPPKIDDPLPQRPDIDPQRRLHDTINSLNRRQRHQLLHFGADGLGHGVRWEILVRHGY